ncbi:MAG: DUF1848 domain-containing protein [Desulfobacterales bacterium]|nr:DUF1848 domain-containing protein [Desulfobacterales bacterium]
MAPNKRIVVSASRRTDIPAFYMDWFMAQVENGVFENINPYNCHVSIVPATPKAVHSIVFWSKNFRPFIEKKYGEKLLEMGFNLYFNFTINAASSQLEPHVPPLDDRFSQLSYLSKNFGPDSINWRFDPICFYVTDEIVEKNNLSGFARIARHANMCNIKRCISSFMDDYKKIGKRTAMIPGFSFRDLSVEKKCDIVKSLKTELERYDIDLSLCCEKDVLKELGENAGVGSASCVSHDTLAGLYEKDLSFKRDTGQRVKSGCGCSASFDIGDYQKHPCYHNCLFCYANPASPEARHH